MRSLALFVALCAGSPAWAQDVVSYDGDGDGEADVLIEDSAIPSWSTRGIGAPTVVYDTVDEQFVMFFEAFFDDAQVDDIGGDWSACRNGEDRPRVVWGIGRATSDDGIGGWVVDPEPVVTPEAGTWRGCQTTHPWVVVDGDTWHMYFKAEQGFNPCPNDGDSPPWGCERVSGVGHASSTDGGRTWQVTDSGEPMLTVSGFGFPSVVARQAPGAEIGDVQWTMLITRDDGLYLATSDDPVDGWTLDEDNPVLTPGTWSFAQDTWLQASLVCNAEDATFPYSAYMGGISNGTISGFDDLNTLDGKEWLGDGRPLVQWEGLPGWRHWDATRVGDEVYVYYTVFGEDRFLRVSLAKVGTDDTFNLDGAAWGGRSCQYGEQPEEPTDDTDATDDTDDPDNRPIGEGEGCYCNSTTLPFGAIPLVGGLLLLAYRRRRS